ncbi:MAG: DUF3040 domain-containing protein [Streptosporangiaceae bacterium]
MTLNERERRTLADIEYSLERSDPSLAWRLRRMSPYPTSFGGTAPAARRTFTRRLRTLWTRRTALLPEGLARPRRLTSRAR